jgi:hypothetical protein
MLAITTPSPSAIAAVVKTITSEVSTFIQASGLTQGAGSRDRQSRLATVGVPMN